jgi:hypothetical protein
VAVKIRRAALRELASLLRGDRCTPRDWSDLIAVANVTLVTPALFSALWAHPTMTQPPAAVVEYLAFVHERNATRNQLIKRMLVEVVGMLNGAGIVPALLKGAAVILTSPKQRIGDRIVSDIDLSVEPGELEEAEAILCRGGFRTLLLGRGMVRAGDPALVELRGHYPGLDAQPRFFAQKQIRARIPSPTALFLHWMVHDLLKEGDVRRGRLEFRHLLDLARLSQGGGVDGRRVRQAMVDMGVGGGTAFDVQMLALDRYFGAALPRLEKPSFAVRVHHWRRVLAVEHDWVGAPVRLAGTSTWAVHKIRSQRSWSGVAQLCQRYASTWGRGANGARL